MRIILTIVTTLIINIASLPAFTHPAKAESPLLQWSRIYTPGQVASRNEIVAPSEVSRFALCSNSSLIYSVDIPGADPLTGRKAVYKSTDGGYSWTDDVSVNLYLAMSPAERANFRVWNIALSPEEGKIVAVVTNNEAINMPRKVWVSNDDGITWSKLRSTISNHISAIAISKYSENYVVSVGTRTGGGGGGIYVAKLSPLNSELLSLTQPGDITALEFSPQFEKDSTLVYIYSTPIIPGPSRTYLDAAIVDVQSQIAYRASAFAHPLEITTGGSGPSATCTDIIGADIDLPSDFFGQAPSQRRFFVSIDATGPATTGIFRFDDTVAYHLMPATSTKRISSITYYGTYQSGKLLAGEVLGNPCSATVMTWFTDAPMTCPVTCWYPAIKPPTGAAGASDCTGSGFGNGQVRWSADGKTAYIGTSSHPLTNNAAWPLAYLTGLERDESAFSVSRNNGLSWNQISLIDTRINRLTDVAPSPDGSSVYIASSNNGTNCSGFDSVWHAEGSRGNSKWERTLCIASTDTPCAVNQTDNLILRLPGNKSDGQAITCAAVGSKLVLSSNNYGDTWAKIYPGFTVQDIAVEDTFTMYLLSPGGQVQRQENKGKGWAPGKMLSTGLDTGYSIAVAYTSVTPDNDKGNIIVGGTGAGDMDVAFSTDSGKSFTVINKRLPTRDNTMVIASSSYKSDGYILAFNSGGMYAWGIYAGDNNWNSWETWWGGDQFPSAVTGLSISRNYGFYLSTPASMWGPATPYIRWCTALAGLDPLISLGAQPTTRFRICGGLESGQSVITYAIDQRAYSSSSGGLWYYVDCLSWEGPTPIDPVSLSPLNFDPSSGRAAGIHLSWKPACLSRGYQIQIAKDSDFNVLIADIGSEWGTYYTPYDLDNPSLFIPAVRGTITDFNGNTWNFPFLEFVAGHTYYWKVRVKDVANGDGISSPWSWRESFIVQEGLPVNARYHGPQLLAPAHQCHCEQDSPLSFSWTPYPGTTAYKFELSLQPDMNNAVITGETGTSCYQYTGNLKAASAYFWRVRAEKPAMSEWSSVNTFSVGAPALINQPHPLAVTPLWVWVVILGTLIAILLITVMIFNRRHGPIIM